MTSNDYLKWGDLITRLSSLVRKTQVTEKKHPRCYVWTSNTVKIPELPPSNQIRSFKMLSCKNNCLHVLNSQGYSLKPFKIAKYNVLSFCTKRNQNATNLSKFLRTSHVGQNLFNPTWIGLSYLNIRYQMAKIHFDSGTLQICKLIPTIF